MSLNKNTAVKVVFEIIQQFSTLYLFIFLVANIFCSLVPRSEYLT